MTSPPSFRGPDRPPRHPPTRVGRGAPVRSALDELTKAGFALLKGPAGAGTSWLAMEVASEWEGPVVWSRPSVFWHLGDLARSLWSGPPPDAVRRGTSEALVECVLDRLRSENLLWVIDDGDDALQPPPGKAHPRDPDLGLLLAALFSDELGDIPGAVLMVSRRVPVGCRAPLHPLPPLPLAEAARLARRSPDAFDPEFGARPACLPLIAALPPDHPLPDPESPFSDLVEAIAELRLDRESREMLLGLATIPMPASLESLCAATGLEDEVARPCLLRLLNHGLARHRAGGWWMPRVLASAARDVLPSLLPGVQPRASLQRLAGWYLRQGVAAGTDWDSIDPARPSRLGLRLWATAGDGPMAMQTVRFGHFATVLAKLRAWRALRDDLGVALGVRLGDVAPGDVAWARHERSLAAWRLGDHAVAEAELVRAVPDAERAGDPVLLGAIHGTLAKRVILSGDPAKARPHLRIALSLAHTHGDTLAECDLENQRGAVALQTGAWDEAEEAFTRSMALAEKLGDDRRVAARSAALGGVAMYQGRLRDADTRLAAAVASARRQGDHNGLVHRLANLALVRSQRQDFRGALSVVGEALVAGGGLDARSAARLLSLRGNLRRLAGDLTGASSDLDQALELATSAGDREGAGQVLLALSHLLRTAGRFSEAAEACGEALETMPTSREAALRASWQIQLHTALAWGAAERAASGTGDGISDLLEASAQARDALKLIPSEPRTARWLGAFQQTGECELLAATTTRTVPHGLAKRLESVWRAACDDTERMDSGEPALHCNLAWAWRLCGHREKAATEARRAGINAGRSGLATVRGRALAVRRAQGIPAWDRQALLLDRLLTTLEPNE
ncbi:MAG: hypothetical protein KDA24_04645 [Deltaproteobacteria bacterium]|nr:hypothetical protein [Deltaproteobacteria bacterium]